MKTFADCIKSKIYSMHLHLYNLQ